MPGLAAVPGRLVQLRAVPGRLGAVPVPAPFGAPGQLAELAAVLEQGSLTSCSQGAVLAAVLGQLAARVAVPSVPGWLAVPSAAPAPLVSGRLLLSWKQAAFPSAVCASSWSHQKCYIRLV